MFSGIPENSFLISAIAGESHLGCLAGKISSQSACVAHATLESKMISRDLLPSSSSTNSLLVTSANH